MNYNKVILGGHLTRDPELTYTPKGTAIAKLGLAVNRKWTSSETGETREEVLFADCTAFGKGAETIAQYLKKGSGLLIDGRLRLEQWEDKQTGDKRSKITVVIEGFQFVGGPSERTEGTGSSGGGEGKRQTQRQSAKSSSKEEAEPEQRELGSKDDDDNDVPFLSILDTAKAFLLKWTNEIVHCLRKVKTVVGILSASADARRSARNL
jgi:single-strand DNA-binding protein